MHEIQITILVSDGFVPTELALAQDTLRIANRLGRDLRFRIRICAMAETETPVEGLGGLAVCAIPFRMDDTNLPDHLVVLGGHGAGDLVTGLRARLRWIERMGGTVVLLSDAARAWKRLHPENADVTTHWEADQLDRDAGHAADRALPLFARTSRITTGAGMLSTADVVLNHIVAPHCLQLAQSVAQVLLMDRIRDGDAPQPRSENDVGALRLAGLEPVITAMERNIETPLKMSELAATAGFSVRQMERKFKDAMAQSPAGFYRSLRLRRARNLIEQTTLPVSEVSVACGLGSASHFSKIFTREFGISPSRRRAELSAKAKNHTQDQGSDHAPLSLPTRSPRPSVHPARADETAVRGAWR